MESLVSHSVYFYVTGSKAFADESLIITTEVDNSAASTGGGSTQAVCETTYDKVFLLSYAELVNTSYGFSADDTRCCKATDWAIANGAAYSDNPSYLYNGYYWTRSPYDDFSDYAYYVAGAGWLHGSYGGFTGYGVRPGLSLRIA